VNPAFDAEEVVGIQTDPLPTAASALFVPGFRRAPSRAGRRKAWRFGRAPARHAVPPREEWVRGDTEEGILVARRQDAQAHPRSQSEFDMKRGEQRAGVGIEGKIVTDQ